MDAGLSFALPGKVLHYESIKQKIPKTSKPVSIELPILLVRSFTMCPWPHC